jgi:hypothetical protein
MRGEYGTKFSVLVEDSRQVTLFEKSKGLTTLLGQALLSSSIRGTQLQAKSGFKKCQILANSFNKHFFN